MVGYRTLFFGDMTPEKVLRSSPGTLGDLEQGCADAHRLILDGQLDAARSRLDELRKVHGDDHAPMQETFSALAEAHGDFNIALAHYKRFHALAVQAGAGSSLRFWAPVRNEARLLEEARSVLTRVGLSGKADVVAGGLAHGEQRQLEVALSLATRPRLLLLDEPMAGMAQEDVSRISALIRRIAAKRTILMVEHNLSVVADLSDKITVLARGEVLAEGPYETVSKDPRVVEAYIGAGHG